MSIAAHILMLARAHDGITIRQIVQSPPNFREDHGYMYAVPSILEDLIDLGLIEIRNEQAEIVNSILGSPGSKVFPLTVHVSNNLAKMQSTLELSLLDLVQSAQGHTIKVMPSFGIPKPIQANDVFVLMPFLHDMLPIYEDHVRRAVLSVGMSCGRADDLFSPSEIMREIWSSIYSSRIIVADCTGRNSNVFYEMGIAHTIGKPVIMLTQNDDDIPFDIKHRKYIKYICNPRGMVALESKLVSALRELNQHKAN